LVFRSRRQATIVITLVGASLLTGVLVYLYYKKKISDEAIRRQARQSRTRARISDRECTRQMAETYIVMIFLC
ncbi:hypothetical protein OESDEN_18663, partial [Oesophagostomum dentatum]